MISQIFHFTLQLKVLLTMRKPEQELAEIKSMMERSTRFLSLSGLAGILAGTFAITAAALAYYWIYYPNFPLGAPMEIENSDEIFFKILPIAIILLVFSVSTAWFLSSKKSIKQSTKIWTPAGKRFIQAFAIPLVVGGVFCLALVYHGYLEIIAPATLIFYGLGLANASQFTLGDIKYLGYCQLGLGILALFFPGFQFLAWSLGFGVLHIVYGSVMYYKYDR